MRKYLQDSLAQLSVGGSLLSWHSQDGLLPEGIHDCTLSSAKKYLATNKHRLELWENLEEVVREMVDWSLTGVLYIAGSFVSDKELPGDLDVTFDMSNESKRQRLLAMDFLEENHRRIMNEYRIQWYVNNPARIGASFIDYFQYAGEDVAVAKRIDIKHKRGILRISSW